MKNSKTVLLIHGYGEDSRVWKKIASKLPKKFNLIIPDLPGCGDEKTKKNISMDGYAKFIDKIVVSRKIKKFTIIGHSMGGYVTMAYAKLFPEKINGLGLIHSHVYADSPEQIESRKKSIEFIRNNGAKKYLPDFVKNLFAETTSKKIVERQLGDVINNDPEGLIAALGAMINRKDTSEVLKKIEIPVLLCFGKSDKIMPLEKMLKQCELPSRSMVNIMSKSGHMSMLEEPGRMAEAIEEYLKWIK